MNKNEYNTEGLSEAMNCFHVQVGLETRTDSVLSIKMKPNQIDEEKIKNEEKDKEIDEALYVDGFEEILENWTQSCLGFLDAFPLFMYITNHVNRGIEDKKLINFLEQETLKKEQEDEGLGNDISLVDYKMGKEHFATVSRKIVKKNQFKRAYEVITKAQLLALLAEYEAFISDVLRLTISERPEAFISLSKTINASEIIKGNDIEDIKNEILENQILDIMRNSHVEIIKTIFSKLSLSIPDDESMKEFGEICLRRNALTHANGVSNKVYRSEMKKLGFSDEEIADEGEKLTIDTRYIRRSIARIYQMGYITTQLVWQHLKRTNRERAVKHLINHSHEFLIAGYTKICGRICEFGLNPKSPADEKDKAYLIVNLALSSLLNDDLEASSKEIGVRDALSKKDWSIVDRKFEMALCCLKEDYENFGDLFDLVKDCIFDANDFMNLAIFTKVREKPIFKEKMLQHYGIEISSEDAEKDIEIQEDD